MYIALIINVYIYGEMCVNLLLFGNYKVLLLFPHYLNRTCEPVWNEKSLNRLKQQVKSNYYIPGIPDSE